MVNTVHWLKRNMAIHPAISFKPYVFEIERSERFMGKKGIFLGHKVGSLSIFIIAKTFGGFYQYAEPWINEGKLMFFSSDSFSPQNPA